MKHIDYSVIFCVILLSLFLIINCNKDLSRLKKTPVAIQIPLTNIFAEVNKNSTTSYVIDNADQDYYAYGTCLQNVNCGNCTSELLCKCPKGYAHESWIPVTSNSNSCQYKLKQQWIFFLLEFFIWCGAGHFYAGRIIYAAVKLSMLAIIIILDCGIKRCFKEYQSRKNFNNVIYLFYFLFLFWQMFDIVMIGFNKFQDGNGFKFNTFSR